MPLWLLCLQALDLRGLDAPDIQHRAEAEARLKALDPERADELAALAEEAVDVERRDRLARAARRLRERKAEALMARGELPEALQALGGDAEKLRRSEDLLRALLRERSAEFSCDVLRPADWTVLEAQLEPLLPWVLPALARGLAPGSRGHDDAVFILTKLGARARPALLWASKHGSPGAAERARSMLARP